MDVHAATAKDEPSRRRRRWVPVVGVIATGIYAAIIAYTTPFTVGADVAVAVPIAAAATLLVRSLLRPTRTRADHARGTGGGDTGTLSFANLAPWLVVGVALVAWETLMFVGAPRSAHPTASSLYDTAARWHGAKAAIAWVWLAVGWLIVRP